MLLVLHSSLHSNSFFLHNLSVSELKILLATCVCLQAGQKSFFKSLRVAPKFH